MQTNTDASTDASRTGKLLYWLVGLVLLILAGWALRAMAAVVVPLVFAIFLILVLRPMDRHIAERLPSKVGWLGRAAVMLLLLVVLAAFITGMVYSTQRLLGTLPDLSDTISEWLSSAEDSAGSGDLSDMPFAEQLGGSLRDSIGAIGSWAVDKAASFAETLISALGGLVAALIVVFFVVLLGLGESSLWSRKMDTLCSGSDRDAWRETLEVISMRVRAFLLVRAALGLFTAVVYTSWLALFGIDLLFVWGLLAFLLTFIPNFGSIISGTLPFIYALLTRDLGTALAVGFGLFVIEQIIGNYIDPRVQGRHIVLSPLIILVALLFWGWLWGVAGALLATPMTIAIATACYHVPALRPVAMLLSNKHEPDELDEALTR